MKNRMIVRYVLVWTAVVFIGLQCRAQTAIYIESVPQNTPLLDLLYVTYKLNDDTSKAVTRTMESRDNHYYFVIEDEPEGVSATVKIHRGSEQTAERDFDTNGPMEHQVDLFQGNMVGISILGWLDLPAQSTMNENVILLDNDLLIPQLGKRRRVWVYLPPEYEVSGKSYPVLYMHDGQNLFDRFTSYVGEWKIDETMAGPLLKHCPQSIIVGIDNGGDDRRNEYSFSVNDSLHPQPKGEEYLSFLVKNLKPIVDSHFRTLKDRANTAIGGSSMGANISLAAISKYPDVFSKAILLSPAYWLDPKLFEIAGDHTPKGDAKIYTSCGTYEGNGEVLQDMLRMNILLSDIGYQEGQLTVMDMPEGQHNEAFWAEEFPKAYQWIMGCEQTEEMKVNAFEVAPNPTEESTKITAPNGKLIRKVEVINTAGKSMRTEEAYDVAEYQLFVNMLFPGTYTLVITWSDNSTDTLPLYKI